MFKGMANFIRRMEHYQKEWGDSLSDRVVWETILLSNIGEKHYRKYMSFLLTVFFMDCELVWLIPPVTITNNIANTFF